MRDRNHNQRYESSRPRPERDRDESDWQSEEGHRWQTGQDRNERNDGWSQGRDEFSGQSRSRESYLNRDENFRPRGRSSNERDFSDYHRADEFGTAGYRDEGPVSTRYQRGMETQGRGYTSNQGYGTRDQGQNYQGNFGQGGLGAGPYGQGQGGFGHQSPFGQPSGFGPQGGNRGLQDSGYARGMDRGSSPSSSENRSTHYGKGPKAFKRTDERMVEEVCMHLTQSDDVDAENIDVSVTDGEVTLSGSVTDRRQKRAAEDAIENVWGVKDIINNIRVQAAGQTGQPRSESRSDRDEGNNKDPKRNDKSGNKAA